MNTPKKITGILVIALLIVGGVYIITKPTGTTVPTNPTSAPLETTNPNSTPTKTPTTPKPTAGGTTTTPTVKTYSASDVATHSSATSCWTSINGNVYDVTAWISQHPGGAQAILSLCGHDGSSAFNDQHGGERRPASELASFKIGILK